MPVFSGGQTLSVSSTFEERMFGEAADSMNSRFAAYLDANNYNGDQAAVPGPDRFDYLDVQQPYLELTETIADAFVFV